MSLTVFSFYKRLGFLTTGLGGNWMKNVNSEPDGSCFQRMSVLKYAPPPSHKKRRKTIRNVRFW